VKLGVDGHGWGLRSSPVSRPSSSHTERPSGLPRIRLHDLRHTHASLLLGEDVHPKAVQERLGHSSIPITLDTYSHVVPALQRRAADITGALLFG
jgi:integrase